MTRVRLNLFPEAREQALTLSYDDSVVENRRFVETINRGGLKCSFHLNSGTLDRENCLQASEVRSLFQGHEISAHSRSHPHLETLSPEEMAYEILEDRRTLESLAGYPVRGMSYPFGTYNDTVVSRLSSLGIEYSRTTQSHHGFHVPNDWLRWQPTCHHRENLLERMDGFINGKRRGRLQLFYLWGHSYEFERNNNWDLLETFVEKVAPHSDKIWFATNIEIFDYLTALKRVRVSVDGHLIFNPSAMSIWVTVDHDPVEVPPGKTLSVR